MVGPMPYAKKKKKKKKKTTTRQTRMYYGELDSTKGKGIVCLLVALLSRPPPLNQTRQMFACWLLYVPAACECISGTDLLRQLYVLPQ